jgi:hypothetical protein
MYLLKALLNLILADEIGVGLVFCPDVRYIGSFREICHGRTLGLPS